MSRSCDLTGVKAQVGRYVPVNRSQTGVRTKRKFSPNIQKVSVLSDSLGRVTLKLAVKTIRTIEHNGGLDKFLLTTSATKLTPKGRALQKEVEAKVGEAHRAAHKPAARKAPKQSPKAIKNAAKKAEGERAPAKKPAAKKPAAKKAAK